jgi:hypothetical protein
LNKYALIVFLSFWMISSSKICAQKEEGYNIFYLEEKIYTIDSQLNKIHALIFSKEAGIPQTKGLLETKIYLKTTKNSLEKFIKKLSLQKKKTPQDIQYILEKTIGLLQVINLPNSSYEDYFIEIGGRLDTFWMQDDEQEDFYEEIDRRQNENQYLEKIKNSLNKMKGFSLFDESEFLYAVNMILKDCLLRIQENKDRLESIVRSLDRLITENKEIDEEIFDDELTEEERFMSLSEYIKAMQKRFMQRPEQDPDGLWDVD